MTGESDRGERPGRETGERDRGGVRHGCGPSPRRGGLGEVDARPEVLGGADGYTRGGFNQRGVALTASVSRAKKPRK